MWHETNCSECGKNFIRIKTYINVILFVILKILERKTKVYYGLAARTFKLRYNGHNTSFNNINYKNGSTLSTHIWKIKDLNINDYELSFQLLS